MIQKSRNGWGANFWRKCSCRRRDLRFGITSRSPTTHGDLSRQYSVALSKPGNTS